MLRSRRAFTLLELALALVIVLILACAASVALSRLLTASALGNGAQAILNALADARQDAVTQNMPVEVRLYAGPASGYTILQLRWREADGTTPPIAAPVLLPSPVVIDATAAHSTLVTVNAATPAPDATDPRLDPLTRCFHFLPSGATDLAAGLPWTLTVRAVTASDPAHFPADWACVTVDPYTGRAQLYRP